MKGFFGVTDNDWFVYVTLLKLDWPKAQGLNLKAIKCNCLRLKTSPTQSSSIQTPTTG
jgi:hypothetical protein